MQYYNVMMIMMSREYMEITILYLSIRRRKQRFACGHAVYIAIVQGMDGLLQLGEDADGFVRVHVVVGDRGVQHVEGLHDVHHL